MPRVHGDRDPTRRLCAEHESCQCRQAAGAGLLGGREHGGPDRRGWMQHGREMRVVVVLQVTEVAVDECRRALGGSQFRSDDRCAFAAAFESCPIDQDLCVVRPRGGQRDSQHVQQRALGLVNRPIRQRAFVGARDELGQGFGYGQKRTPRVRLRGREYSTDGRCDLTRPEALT